MQCFARWHEDTDTGLCFRNQTILQFGDSWEVLANFILLNPGSAVPKNPMPQDDYLLSQNLPFTLQLEVYPYHEFSIDPLMRDLIKLYAEKYSGGVIKIYNLFDLKNQHSNNALEHYKTHKLHSYMQTPITEIDYCNAPVVIACGENAFADEDLVQQLKTFIALADKDKLYALSRINTREFSVVKAEPDEQGIVQSYHPSFTFKYGNRTLLNI